MTIVSSCWLRGCFLTHCLYPLDAPARVHRAFRQAVLIRNALAVPWPWQWLGTLLGLGPGVSMGLPLIEAANYETRVWLAGLATLTGQGA